MTTIEELSLSQIIQKIHPKLRPENTNWNQGDERHVMFLDSDDDLKCFSIMMNFFQKSNKHAMDHNGLLYCLCF